MEIAKRQFFNKKRDEISAMLRTFINAALDNFFILCYAPVGEHMAKFLISGQNWALVNYLFSLEDPKLEVLYTTENFIDIKLHAKLFEPDVFILCAKEQNSKQLEDIARAREFLGLAQKHFYIIGFDNELDAIYTALDGNKITDTIACEVGNETIVKRLLKLSDEIQSEKMGAFDPNVLENVGVPNAAKTVETMNAKNEPSFAQSSVGAERIENHSNFVSETIHNIHEKIQNNIHEKIENIHSLHKEVPPVQVVSKKKIMIVDDDPTILRAMRNFLQDKYIILVASSGKIALKFLEEKVVDLIFLDYLMPDMDGEAVLNCIRHSVLTYKIPVVFLTSVSDRDKIRHILGMNVQGYLLKPVNSKKLLEFVHKILGDE